jgi:hypothetical protein
LQTGKILHTFDINEHPTNTKMKFKHLLLVAASILFIQGCDEIDGPYGVTNNGGIDTSDNIVRKVLIEDFTGHTCQACPNAHREATRLHNLFGEQLVILAIHADFWADPYPSGAPYFTYDFRNPTSTQIATDYNVVGQPFPKGMVNRMLNTSTNTQLILDWANWEPKVNDWLAIPADAGIEITPTYNETNRNITADVTVKIVNELTDPVSLAVYFSEDSILQWQKDGSTNVQNYVHNHVLRGSLNGTYGESLGIQAAGAEITRTYSATLVPNDAVADHIHLVAILSNEITKEIIQVEEIKLK